MATPSWISNMFPDIFGNGGPKPAPSSDFTEFTDQSSRTSMKSGRGTMEEKLKRGQTIYRDGAPVPGGTSISVDDQTRNLDDRGTGQGVNFFGYGNATKKNPYLEGKRSDDLNITTNANSLGQVEISGFRTKSAPMMESDYGGGTASGVAKAADSSFYRNLMDTTRYGGEYKGLGDPDVVKLTLDGTASPTDNTIIRITGKPEPPAKIKGAGAMGAKLSQSSPDPLKVVQRKIPNFSTQEAGRGKGGGDAWLSKYYFDHNEELYSPVNIESNVTYPAHGNVHGKKYMTRLQSMTNDALQTHTVNKLGGSLDKLATPSPNGDSMNRNKIRSVTMSGDLPSWRGGGMVSNAIQIDSGEISNASPLLVGKTWEDSPSPELNKNFNRGVVGEKGLPGIYDPPTGEGRPPNGLLNKKSVNTPSSGKPAAKVISRLGMSVDDRRKEPYHTEPSSPSLITPDRDKTNASENSLPRSKQMSYVDDDIGKSTNTVRLEESLKTFGADYSTRLKGIGELNEQDELKVQNDIKNLVDLKNLADGAFERRTKEAPNLKDVTKAAADAETKTYGQRFYDNPFHLNKRKLPNYTIADSRKDPFNIRGVLDAEEHSMVSEPDWASEDFIPLYFHDLVNKKYIPFRALLQGMSDQADSSWSSTQYLGRADEVHVYTGFKRTLSIDFGVVAFSVEELHPMWQRINYMVGLTHPAKYTEHDFIVPPFVRFNLGDIYKNQPVLITSVSTEIPPEASWELVNNEKNNGPIKRDNFEYANGDIKRKDVKVARYPTSCNLKVSMIMLEKFSPETKQNHFGSSPLHTNGEGSSTFNEDLANYDESNSNSKPSAEEDQSRKRGLQQDANANRNKTNEERKAALSKSSREAELKKQLAGGFLF